MTLALVYGQEEENKSPCAQKLETAQQKYDEGRIQDIEGLLKKCIDTDQYSKAEKAQALRLMTLSYIFLENQEAAEASMLALLKTNHEFAINEAIDPTEFINLYNRYRTEPLFSVGLKYIVNWTKPYVTNLNSAFTLGGNEVHDYTYTLASFGLGASFEYKLTNNIVIYPEIQYMQRSIVSDRIVSGPASGAEVYTLKTQDDQNWLMLPVSGQYLFHLSDQFKLFATAGISTEFLLSSTFAGKNTELTQATKPSVGGIAITATADRNRLNFSAIIGGGVKIKVSEGFITVEARYSQGLTRVTKANNSLSPSDPNLLFTTFYQDDGYRLNHIAVSVGYIKRFYFPKKLR